MSKVKEKQAKRRSEIIESLIPLMTSEDFDKISVSDLCQTAGISIGTFYHYFTKKSEKENTFPLLTNEDEMENLRMFARGWASYIQSHGLERSKLISGVNPEGWGNLEKERISFKKIQEIFEAARKKGQISKRFTVDELTDFFLLMLRSVSTDWSRREGSYDIVKKMDGFTEFFIQGCQSKGNGKTK